VREGTGAGEMGRAGSGHSGRQVRAPLFFFSFVSEAERKRERWDHQPFLQKVRVGPKIMLQYPLPPKIGLGKFGTLLKFSKMKRHYLVLLWHCLKCSSPNYVDGDVVFTNNICFGIFATS
jgi:hypothetical protein